MRRTLIWAAASGLAAVVISPIARGCGDRTLALLYGVRFGQAFKAPRPASILIYSAGSSGTALARDTELQKALQDAGHKIQSVPDLTSLQQSLKSGKYDVVLADFSGAAGITQEAQKAPSHPTVVPVMLKPDKAARDLAAKQHTPLLKVPAKVAEYFAAIDEIMKRRGSPARS